MGGGGAALGGVLNYFAGHQGRLNYAPRLRRGQSIGSGLVEGSIKQLLNLRLKQTGARRGWGQGGGARRPPRGTGCLVARAGVASLLGGQLTPPPKTEGGPLRSRSVGLP